MSELPMMSKVSRELLVKVRQMVPPMLEKFHKGEGNVPLRSNVVF